MKRKTYQKPTMTVVKLQSIGMLMTSTEGTQANRSGYGAANNQNWDEEE